MAGRAGATVPIHFEPRMTDGKVRGVERTGSYDSLIKALKFLNQDEPAREKFETGYRRVRVLYETLQPDEFLVPYEQEYIWPCKLRMAYRKKCCPMQRNEISPEDGAKTRELIRRHVDMEELKIRIGEDEDFLPLSERLKAIVAAKRNGRPAGIALISELEKLTQQVVGLIEESKRPIRESIAKAAMECLLAWGGQRFR
jgi:type I restriction enzyme R subunit